MTVTCWIVGGLSTLVLHRGARAGVLQELQQKRLHDVGAAVESRQDVQQPPSSLTTLPAQRNINTNSELAQAWLSSFWTRWKTLRGSYGLELVLPVTCFITWQNASSFMSPWSPLNYTYEHIFVLKKEFLSGLLVTKKNLKCNTFLWMLVCENLEYGGDQILLSLTLQWEISHELHYSW